MRTICLLVPLVAVAALFLVLATASNAEAPDPEPAKPTPGTFPADWAGIWKGTLVVSQPGGGEGRIPEVSTFGVKSLQRATLTR